jgi:hypothetical protein
LEDAGDFSCVVKSTKTSCRVKVLGNCFLFIHYTFFIHEKLNLIWIKEKPAALIHPLEDQEVVEKQTATFECTLNKPRLKVTWFKNNQKLSENDRIQFIQDGKVYKLVIDNAKLEDAAIYKIKFSDEGESKAQLYVKGFFFS